MSSEQIIGSDALERGDFIVSGGAVMFTISTAQKQLQDATEGFRCSKQLRIGSGASGFKGFRKKLTIFTLRETSSIGS